MANYVVSKNADGSFNLKVTKVVSQESTEEFNFGTSDEVAAKVKEVEDTPAA